MQRLSRLSALALAAAVLAGCGVGPGMSPVAGKQIAKSGVAARALSPDDIEKAVEDACAPAREATMRGVPAVLQYPSDAGAQRALQNVFASTRPTVMSHIGWEVDESLHDLQIEDFFKDVPQVSDPEVVNYLQGVADRLTTAIGEKPFKVYVADISDVNAFNAGGHAMVVFKGLLTTVKDESELAGVMAHEMTHGLKRHAIQGWVTQHSASAASQAAAGLIKPSMEDVQMASSWMTTLAPSQRGDFDFVMGFLKGKIGAPTQSYLGYTYNSNFAVLANSRAMEAEADQGGVRMLAAAGYDANGLWRTFERMMTRPDGDTRYYSHPALGSRVASIKAQIAAEGLKGRDKGRDRLAAIVAKLKGGTPTAGTTPGAKFVALPKHAAGAGCFQEELSSFWSTDLQTGLR